MPNRRELIFLGKTLYKNVNDDRILIFSGYVAYTTILALFPFIIFMVAMAGFFGGTELAGEIVARGFAMLPDEVMKTLSPVVYETMKLREGKLLTIGILGTIWAASAGVESLRDGLNIAHHLEEKRGFIRRRLQGLAVVIGGSLIFLLLSTLLIGGPIAIQYVAERFHVDAATLLPVQIVRFAASFLILTTAIVVMYRVLPNTTYKWRALLPGAVLATVLWMGLASLFSLYLLHFGSYNVTYGSLGGIIATIAFFQLSILIILVGAEMNVAWHMLKGEEKMLTPDAKIERQKHRPLFHFHRNSISNAS